MAEVDPFVIQWPRQWTDDPEIGPVIHYLNRFLHDLFIRTGGGTDAIADLNVRETYPWPVAPLAEESKEFTYPPPQIFPKSFNNITKDINYTAVSYDFVNAKRKATIKFPKFPDENDVIIIRNGDGTVISLDGNGKNINGSTAGKLFRKETAINFHYFIDSDEWFAR